MEPITHDGATSSDAEIVAHCHHYAGNGIPYQHKILIELFPTEK